MSPKYGSSKKRKDNKNKQKMQMLKSNVINVVGASFCAVLLWKFIQLWAV